MKFDQLLHQSSGKCPFFGQICIKIASFTPVLGIGLHFPLSGKGQNIPAIRDPKLRSDASRQWRVLHPNRGVKRQRLTFGNENASERSAGLAVHVVVAHILTATIWKSWAEKFAHIFPGSRQLPLEILNGACNSQLVGELRNADLPRQQRRFVVRVELIDFARFRFGVFQLLVPVFQFVRQSNVLASGS